MLAYTKALDCRVEADQLASVAEKMGDLKLEQGDLESAAGYFEKAAAARPSSLRKLGWVRGLKGEFEESVGILRQCEQSATGRGDEIETARVWSDLGYIYAMQSLRDQSLEVLEKAREVFERSGMHLEAGQASNRTGVMEWKAGDFRRAAQAWRSAKAYFDRAGDRKRAAVCLMSLGLCHRKEMDFAGAERCFEDALSIFTDIRAMGEKASCQQNYALLLLDQGSLQRATELAREGLAVSSLLGWHSNVVTCGILLGALAVEAGDWSSAEKRLSGLLQDEKALDTFQKAMAKRYLALAACLAGRTGRARQLARESHDLACEARDAEGPGQALLAESTIMLRTGMYREAENLAREALVALVSSSSMLLTHEARRMAGEALCRAGKPAAGIAEISKPKAVSKRYRSPCTWPGPFAHLLWGGFLKVSTVRPRAVFASRRIYVGLPVRVTIRRWRYCSGGVMPLSGAIFCDPDTVCLKPHAYSKH